MKKGLFSSIVLGCLFLLSCGGGGGGGSSSSGGSSLSQTNATAAGSAMLQSANLVTTAQAIGGVQVLSVSQASKPPLQNIIGEMLSVSQKHAQGGRSADGVTASGAGSSTANCTDGGSVSVSATWTGPDNPTDLSQVVNLSGTVIFNSCKEGTETFNGTAALSVEGPLNAPTKLVVSSSSLSYANTANNDSVTLGNLTITLSNIVISGNNLTSFTTTMSGTFSGTLSGDSVNIECDNFQIVFNSSASGQTVSISGSVKASCIGGWVTITTTKPLFFPRTHCPVDGDITAASGGNSVRLTVGPGTMITIFFNGNLVQTYNSCTNIEGLCTG